MNRFKIIQVIKIIKQLKKNLHFYFSSLQFEKNQTNEANMFLNDDVRKNVYANGQKILMAIVDHYESGGVDFEEHNHMFMSLIASVTEGKVEGSVSEDGKLLWSLTESYRKELSDRAEQLQNVIQGPWK